VSGSNGEHAAVSNGTHPHSGRRKADDTLAVSLAAGQTLREAAKAAGVSERTATNRWAEPGFKARVCTLRAEAVSRALGRLSETMTTAADTLAALLSDQDARVRLGAARAVIELGVRLREGVELEQRITELESRLREREA
jgi:hypothetical protein